MECIDCGNYETCTDYDKEFWGEKEGCKDFKNRIGETEGYRVTDNEIINAFEEISKKQNGRIDIKGWD